MAIIKSTARASSVFLSSYRNTVLNQSACVFALGYKCCLVNLSLSGPAIADSTVQEYSYSILKKENLFVCSFIHW